jgi:ABC-type Zn uptake system ZnuABC Zn-binding protein ZnuA
MKVRIHGLLNNLIIILSRLFIFTIDGFAPEKLFVVFSCVPQECFVQQIGKDLVGVQVMVPLDAGLATHEPKPRQVVQAIGDQVAFADPLAEDWMANMRQLAAKLQAALR